tara:strand:+ start:892 stop:2169 length:1278 start_codon:yes stop_codon:yes gene_type:complete
MSIEEKKSFQIYLDSDLLKPENEQNVSELIRQTYKKNLPIEIIGSSSKKFIGYNLQTAKILDISNLSGILEYHPEELYIKVKAGTPLKLIEETLDKNNQQLAFEPIDFGYINNGKSNKGTIGGYVSCNFSGSRRFKMGSVRDHILGFRGVNGKGDIIKSGGIVVKNVTGYDLSKVVTGSFGTLVALTEITLKVSPKKPSQSTIVIHTEDTKQVSKLFDKILSSSDEISGSVYIPNEPKNKKFESNKNEIFKFNDLKYKGSFLAFRIEGDQKSILERKKNLTKELELNKLKTSTLDVYQSILFWQKINNLELFNNTKNNILRAVVPLSNNEQLMKYIKNKYKYYIDWSGSLFWIEVHDKDEKKIKEIKKFIIKIDGYLTIIKRSENFSFQESLFTINDNKLFISKKIKESFDPKRIFNPGRMYREI